MNTPPTPSRVSDFNYGICYLFTVVLVLMITVGSVLVRAETKTDQTTKTAESVTTGTLTTSGTMQISGDLLKMADLKAVTTTIKIQEAPGAVFELNGIPQGQALVSGSAFALPSYQRPEKPEQVTAFLWTSDGKKWKAEWKEVLP